MQKPILLCCIFFLLSACPGQGQFRLDVEKTVLPNGLTLLTYVDTTAPTVSYRTFINAGSRDETKAGATGIAHVFEHMMFRGTEKYPNYNDAVARMGPQTNAGTSDDLTDYFVNAKAEFLREIIEVESDRIRNLRFTREAFRTELGTVKEERRRGVDDDPGGFLYQELFRLAFKKHTYHHPVIGWEDDLEKTLTFEDGYAFKKTFYSPNYCTIVICGNFDPEKAGEWVLENYGDWKTSLPPTSQVRTEPTQEERRRRDFEWKDSHTAPLLLIGYKGPDLNLDTPDLAALQVLSKILFSKTGRLYKKLKSDTDKVERIRGEIEGRKDPGLFVIDATLKEGQDFDSIIAIIEQELTGIVEGQIPDDELARAVNPMKSEFLFRLSTPYRIGGSIGYFHLTGGDYRMMFAYYDMLGRITADDVKEAARKYLIPAHSTIVTLSPLQSS